ncbi:MAG: hypothetical protein R3212_09710, partial [Xanthomonadales bacterium]|nr:hypothetical protein [Xanthomonadales bacterium]
EWAAIATPEFARRFYVQESEGADSPRVWSVGHESATNLVDDDGAVIETALQFFASNNHLYFYGRNGNGDGLYRIPNGASPPTARMAAVTGSWYDPATAGQGLAIHTFDEGTTVAYFYGYRNDGSRRWLIGVADEPLELGATARFDMFVASGGRFGGFNAQDITETPWGTLDLRFDGCTYGEASLSGLDGQQTMQVRRFVGTGDLGCSPYEPNSPKAGHPGIAGSWYEAATAGQGLALHLLDHDSFVLYFYGFEDSGAQLWLIGVHQGGIEFGQPLIVPMNVTSGGRFGGFSPGDIVESEWGTATITFDDCTNATVTLSGLHGEQSLEADLFIPVQGTQMDCPGT